MAGRDRAREIQGEYESILERALREPGIAEVLEVHEHIEKASAYATPSGTLVQTTTSTSSGAFIRAR